MDLSKMSVDDLHIQHRKAWTQDEWERSFACFDELARRLAVMTAKYGHAADTVRESCQVYERICREYRETIEAMNAKIRDAHSRPGFDCPCEYCSEVRHG
jgi:hypothetical protein